MPREEYFSYEVDDINGLDFIEKLSVLSHQKQIITVYQGTLRIVMMKGELFESPILNSWIGLIEWMYFMRKIV